jgi:hypothetical protein
MAILLDYSGGKLSGTAVAGAGAAGVIRYAGTPQYGKNTNPSEVTSLHAAGRDVHGVFELGTDDFAGGYNAGVNNARALLNDANNCGITGALFMSVDRHISGGQITTWQQYINGAATVLGNRLGGYGFSEAMNAIRGVAHYFWQAGSHPNSTGTADIVNVWQRNSGQTTMVVGGVLCDINDILKPLGDTLSILPADVTAIADGVVRALIAFRDANNRNIFDTGNQAMSTGFQNQTALSTVNTKLDTVGTKLTTIDGSVKALSTPTVDITALSNAVVAGLVPHLPAAVDTSALAAAVVAGVTPLLPAGTDPAVVAASVLDATRALYNKP